MNARAWRDQILLVFRRRQERYRLFTLDVAATVAQCLVSGNPAYGIPGTPVDTGFARASWYTLVNGSGSPSLPGSLNPTGDVSLLVGALAAVQFGDKITFANNAPYINRLEFDGWSAQASQGWVRLTAVAFPLIVHDAYQRTVRA